MLSAGGAVDHSKHDDTSVNGMKLRQGWLIYETIGQVVIDPILIQNFLSKEAIQKSHEIEQNIGIREATI